MKIGKFSVIKQILWGALLSLLSGCGDTFSLSLKEKLLISMIGVFEAPDGAEGNGEPRSMSFTLENVTLMAEDGAEIDLYEGEPAAFAIINRSQIIAEADVTDHVGESFSGIRVSFAPDAVVTGKVTDKIAVTLPQPELMYSQAVTIEKAKELRLNIKTQWKNIVTRDDSTKTESAVPPSFVLEIAYD